MHGSTLTDDTTLEQRKSRAIDLTRLATEHLAQMQVSVKIIGSLTDGRFGPQSDIDFLITKCPRDLKYRLEGLIEDILAGFSFDVVYLDEIPPHRVNRMTKNAIDARDLR